MIPKNIAGVMAVLMLMVFPTAARAMDPMATIKAPIDAVITILNDPQYQQKDAKSAQRDQIWKIVKPIFDFDQISRLAVSRNWQDFSAAEKTAFAEVFAEFLGNLYIDRIQGEYHNEQIVYLGQDFYSNNAKAEVRTQIIRETIATPVTYMMFKNPDSQWKVYDVKVEGVGLVRTWRTQIADTLKKETPAQLIQNFNEKVAQQNKQLSNNG